MERGVGKNKFGIGVADSVYRNEEEAGMRKFALSLAIGSFFAICLFSSVSAVPDPRDSVIIEFKTIAPGIGTPAAAVGVYISNKDSLIGVTLELVERSISGGAYMTLAWPRDFEAVVGSLNSPLQKGLTKVFVSRNGTPPDSFSITALWNPRSWSGTVEPPNLVRKRLLEIKFDSVLSNEGEVELDSAFWHLNGSDISTGFVIYRDSDYMDLPVNFVKGVITVAEPARGDMDGNGAFTALDVILLSNCVFVKEGYQPRADLTCDGAVSPADVVAILRKVFLEAQLSECPF